MRVGKFVNPIFKGSPAQILGRVWHSGQTLLEADLVDVLLSISVLYDPKPFETGEVRARINNTIQKLIAEAELAAFFVVGVKLYP